MFVTGNAQANNASGQYKWLEHILGFNITNAIPDELATIAES